MNHNALLVGNGLNRAADDAAWEDLLTVLCGHFKVPRSDKYSNFPLEYERIYLYALSQGTAKENDIKADTNIHVVSIPVGRHRPLSLSEQTVTARLVSELYIK